MLSDLPTLVILLLLAGAVLLGFAGVALLVRPGEQSGDAGVLGLLACVGAVVMWASGSFASAFTIAQPPQASSKRKCASSVAMAKSSLPSFRS